MGRLVPVFDILSGVTGRDAEWIETVPGLANAVDRMREIASRKPGRYFIFDRETHQIVTIFEAVPEPKTGRSTLRKLG